MKTRTSTKTVTFRRPFALGKFDEVLPAGDYSVETDEEILEGISFLAYRRIMTLIRLHAKSCSSGFPRALAIDPNELEAALVRDQATAEIPVDSVIGQGTSERTTGSRREEVDHQATEWPKANG